MKFDAEELYNIAISEYEEADFILDGADGFSQREGLSYWAAESADEEYESEEDVREEIRRYIKEEKSMEYSF